MGLIFSSVLDSCAKHKEDPKDEKAKPQKSIQTQQQPALGDFQVLKLLGKGAQGKVVLVEMKTTKKIYAMKIVDITEEQASIKAEKMILQQTQHPFILNLYFAFQTDRKIYLGTEFVNGGELFTHLRREKQFTEQRAQFYAAEIVLALKYLHENGIIYRDLKPENILLDCYGHIKLTDFGISKVEFNKVTYTTCGTPEYVAPEILFEQGYNQSVDWYSLGILIYEMLSGAPPFYSQDKNKMIEERLSKPLDMPQHFSPTAISLIQGLTELQADLRLGRNGSEEIMNHQFFNSINWDLMYQRQVEPPFRPTIQGKLDVRNFDNVRVEKYYQQFTQQPQSQIKSMAIEDFNYCKISNENLSQA